MVQNMNSTKKQIGDRELDVDSLEQPVVEHNRFYQSVMMLPSRYQEALVLKYVAGLRIDDVAVVMKMPLGQASTLLSEAHAALVDELNSSGPEKNMFDVIC
jgi:DNA-directed RNA polymerase specialized sigma24 family protein